MRNKYERTSRREKERKRKGNGKVYKKIWSRKKKTKKSIANKANNADHVNKANNIRTRKEGVHTVETSSVTC